MRKLWLIFGFWVRIGPSMEGFHMSSGVWLVPVVLAGGIGCYFLYRYWQHFLQHERLKHARQIFHRRREWLEARFLTKAGQSGKPRGLAWTDCDFENPVTFARDRESGQLNALVGVTISFSAIEGGGMEDVEAVGNLRSATAVFRFDKDHWDTDGRAVFNLNPTETIQHFRLEVERV
jgi:hypothetical protein